MLMHPKFLALAAALLLSPPALAGSMTFSMDNGGGTPFSKSITPSNADVTSVIAAYKPSCPQVDTGTKDAQGNPILRACTNAETFNYIASGLFAGLKANTDAFNRNAAGSAAAAAVAPVTLQ